MKKFCHLYNSLCFGYILFYPRTSPSNASDSLGGKIGFPNDGASCVGYHNAEVGAGTTITTNNFFI